MSEVKIVHHRPLLKWILLVGVLFSSVFAGMVGFHLGERHASRLSAELLLQEQGQLVAERADLTAEVAQQAESLSLLRKELEISQKANRHLQQDYKQYYDKLALLEEEITYYKRVLKPGPTDEGIVLGSLEIKASSRNQVFRLVTDVLQVRDMKKLKGKIDFILIGRKNGQVQELDVSQLKATEASKFELGFRHYQTIRAELALPSGFSPEQVKVVAQFTSGKRLKISRIYDWIVQES